MGIFLGSILVFSRLKCGLRKVSEKQIHNRAFISFNIKDWAGGGEVFMHYFISKLIFPKVR